MLKEYLKFRWIFHRYYPNQCIIAFAELGTLWNNSLNDVLTVCRAKKLWGFVVIDVDGYRLNVGVVLVNQGGKVLLARRIGQHAWQFPQGGMRQAETSEQALFRELYEELGLEPGDVEIMGCTKGWLRYRLPKQLIRYYSQPLCIGQKQKWFMLRFIASEQKIRLDLSDSPEFDSWRWVNYWYPIKQVIAFKRGVYRRALQELAPLLRADARSAPPSSD